VLDAETEATAVGNARTANILLIGAAVRIMGLADIDWAGIIAENVRKSFVEVNRKAFLRGMALVGGN